jgi:hypothetical protein
MSKFISRCLFFAFLSLFIGGSLASINNLHCIANLPITQCESSLAAATSSWTSSAAMVLALAVQSQRDNQ